MDFEIIFACDIMFGIGVKKNDFNKNTIPWNISDDMAFF
jgi:hypothetical protein